MLQIYAIIPKNQTIMCPNTIILYFCALQFKMAQQLTIKQIAELAGVSVGTVDRVLHNRGRVSDEALAAIRSVLDKESYKYNLHTSAVAFKRTKKSFDIAVAIPSSQPGEYWDLIKTGIDAGFAEYGDISLKCKYVFFDQFNSISCREAFDSIDEKEFSAVIIGTTFVDETLELCQRLDNANVPYAFVDGKVQGASPVAIYHADQNRCGRLLAHLLDAFSPNDAEIAIMLPRRTGTQLSNNSAIRLQAFMEYFRESDSGRIIKEGHFPTDNPEAIRKEVSDFIGQNPKVKGIAVVISTGYMICDALSACGVKDIRIGGFDVTQGNARCVREGSLDFLINQHPDKQGFQAVESTLHYLLYGTPDKSFDEYLPIDIAFKENLQ